MRSLARHGCLVGGGGHAGTGFSCVLPKRCWSELWIEPGLVSIDVDDEGVATLAGRLDRTSTAVIAVRLAEAVPGVVDVVDKLEYAHDDTDRARIRFERSDPFDV